MKLLTDVVNKLTSGERFYRNKMFLVGASMLVPAYLAWLLWSGAPPRKDHFDGMTLPQQAGELVYRKDTKGGAFDTKKTVEEHMEILEKPLEKGDLDGFDSAIWKYVHFWYGEKRGSGETGKDMLPYCDIVQGNPGSCTEGSVAFWANWKKVRENPVTQDKYNHTLLLVTYERSDKQNIAGHCLYLRERIDKEGTKSYSIGGINPFEDSSVEFETVEEAVENNMDLFRYYCWQNLTTRGIMVRPNKWSAVDPRDLGIDLVHGEGRLNRPVKGKDARETYAGYCQRVMTKHFEKHGKLFMEPKSK